MVYLGLPINNGGSFHGYVSHNQMVVSDINHSDIRRIIAMYSELLTINHCNYNITNGDY